MAATTMQLISLDPVRAPARRRRRSNRKPSAPETCRSGSQQPSPTKFLPLEPGIVSGEIPAFFIGRNMEGFWVAGDAQGRIGIFLLQSSAVSFASSKSPSAARAAIFPPGRFEPDLQNQGNPFVVQLGWFKRLAMRESRRAAIKRSGIGVLAVLTATGALAAITGLKAAIYYSRFHN